jgi:hypothetical protein
MVIMLWCSEYMRHSGKALKPAQLPPGRPDGHQRADEAPQRRNRNALGAAALPFESRPLRARVTCDILLRLRLRLRHPAAFRHRRTFIPRITPILCRAPSSYATYTTHL